LGNSTVTGFLENELLFIYDAIWLRIWKISGCCC
jgi:hypothetical protein